MSKRKSDDEPKMNIKQEPTIPTIIATPVRAAQICNTCHQPKAGRTVIYEGEQMHLTHAQTCARRCIYPDTCSHRTHRVAKKIKQKASSLDAATKNAILAGFKPQEHVDFKKSWEEHLKKNKLSSTTLPGPGQLNMMIQACHNYAVEQVQQVTPTVPMTSASANSVVALFESGLVPSPTATSTSKSISSPMSTSTSTPTHTSTKHQCNNCSWICDDGVNITGTRCNMCSVGEMFKAVPGATFSPKIFQSAINIIKASTPTSTPTATPTSTSISTPTATPTSTSISTPTPTSTSTSTCSHALITPMDPHNIQDLTFEIEDDFPLPVVKSPIKTYADASTQTNHTMEFPHLKSSTSTPLTKVTDAFACKKPLGPRIIQSNKENMSHAANVLA